MPAGRSCTPRTRGHCAWRAHAVREGTVLVVNPLQTHSTADFAYEPGDEMRRMVAFFVNADVVKGLGTGLAHAEATGLAAPPPKKAHRGK